MKVAPISLPAATESNSKNTVPGGGDHTSDAGEVKPLVVPAAQPDAYNGCGQPATPSPAQITLQQSVLHVEIQSLANAGMTSQVRLRRGGGG